MSRTVRSHVLVDAAPSALLISGTHNVPFPTYLVPTMFHFPPKVHFTLLATLLLGRVSELVAETNAPGKTDDKTPLIMTQRLVYSGKCMVSKKES